jgi:predicted secreted protein
VKKSLVLGPAALLAVLAVVLVAGCGSTTVGVTPADSGSTVTVASGDKIQIKLPESPSQNQKWVQMKVTKGLTVDSSTFTENENPGHLAGVEGTRTWMIGVDGSGTQTIHGVYTNTQRPADNPQYFSLTVKVQ